MREETHCRHMGYSFWLTARVLLYAPPHRQDSIYHGLSYTSRGALAGTGNSSAGPPHEGSIWRPIAPWANAFTMELHLAPVFGGVFFLGGVEAGVLGGSLFCLVFLFTRLTQHVYFYSLNLFRSICPLCHTQQTKCFSGWDVIKHVSLIHIF